MESYCTLDPLRTRAAFAIEAKGGKNSFYAVDYAARTASGLGADIVKVNFPASRAE